MANKAVFSAKAPDAIGPYSHAVKAGDTIYVSGQIGAVKETGEFAGDCVKCQTEQALKNMAAILAEEGYSLADVVKTTVFLSDIGNFGAMNEVYAQYFTEPFPARSAFQVAALPKGALVEIEAIAVKQ